MGFKFKSLHIVSFAVIVAIILGFAIILGLAYMLKSNRTEGFENATTTIVTEAYYTQDKQSNNAKEFFGKYGVAPYTDEYTATNLLDIDLNTLHAFFNKYGGLQNWKNEAGQMLWLNESFNAFFQKIGFEDGPGGKIRPKVLNGNFYFEDPTDNKIHILDDDEMAKKIFSQLTTNKNLNPNGENRTSSGMERAAASAGTSTGSTLDDSNSNNNNYGVGQDNYNHFNGSSVPTMFYGPNGSTAKISTQNGTYSVIVTDNKGTSVVYDEENKSVLAPSSLAAIDMVIDKIVEAVARVQKASSNASTSASTNASSSTQSNSVMKYYGQDGSVAVMYTDKNGNSALKIIDKNGKEHSYNSSNIQSFNPSMDNPDGPQTTGNTISPNATNQASSYSAAYSQSLTKDDYSSSLPKGIPKYMIPPGNDDLYILKSEVVPPVCPVCPPQILKCGDNKPPPPCPPCARCPEPKFDCKKVPNYGNGNLGANYFGGGGQFGSMPSTSGNFLPFPSLSDYTTFGN